MDLGELSGDGSAAKIQTDPLEFIDALWALYEARFEQQGIKDIESLEALIDAENMVILRETVLEELNGFFPVIKMVSTKIAEALTGNLDFQEESQNNGSLSTTTS